jgi:hypothetical protein
LSLLFLNKLVAQQNNNRSLDLKVQMLKLSAKLSSKSLFSEMRSLV